MDKVTVSRAAIALAERGLVARAPNPGDQRSHLLALSAAGRALYDEVAPKALEIEARDVRRIEPAENRCFRAMLTRIEAAAAPGRSARGDGLSVVVRRSEAVDLASGAIRAISDGAAAGREIVHRIAMLSAVAAFGSGDCACRRYATPGAGRARQQQARPVLIPRLRRPGGRRADRQPEAEFNAALPQRATTSTRRSSRSQDAPFTAATAEKAPTARAGSRAVEPRHIAAPARAAAELATPLPPIVRFEVTPVAIAGVDDEKPVEIKYETGIEGLDPLGLTAGSIRFRR